MKSKNSSLLPVLLVIQTLSIIIYTLIAFNNEGFTLFQIFFSNIISLTWNGQFNLDFSFYLLLSGIWVVWRNNFSPLSYVLALITFVMGIAIFAPYLVYLYITENGNIIRIIVGNNADFNNIKEIKG
jgi:hypothetical protein